MKSILCSLSRVSAQLASPRRVSHPDVPGRGAPARILLALHPVQVSTGLGGGVTEDVHASVGEYPGGKVEDR